MSERQEDEVVVDANDLFIATAALAAFVRDGNYRGNTAKYERDKKALERLKKLQGIKY